MNATDIRLMEAPDALCLSAQYRADEVARDRSWEASVTVLKWSRGAASDDTRQKLAALACDLEDVDSQADVETLLRHADSQLIHYGDLHYDVIEEILRPIVDACEGVR